VRPGADNANESSDRSGRARAVVSFACFAFGISIADRWPELLGSAAWFGAACAVLACAAATRGVLCRLLLCAAFVLLGAGVYTGRAIERPADDLTRLVRPAIGATALLEARGIVTSDPYRSSPERRPDLPPTGSSWVFDLDIERAGDIQASGVVRVMVRGDERPGVRPGDRVRAGGTYEPPRPPMNPGEPDRTRMDAVGGRSGTLFVDSAAMIEIDERSARSGPGVWLAKVRGRARSVLGLDEEPSDATRLVAALALGDRGGAAGDAVREPFAKIGTAHMLAISGFHLVVMAGIGLWILRLGRDRGWAEPALIAALVLVYMLLVPARPPVVRAGVMALALLAAEATGRRQDRVSVLAWVAIALLVWRPTDLFLPGFRLSVGLTAALVWVGPRVAARLEERWAARFGVRDQTATLPARWKWSGLRALTGALVTGPAAQAGIMTLVCWLAGLGLIAHETGRVSPIGIVATLVLLPVVVGLLWFGLLAVLAGLVYEPIGRAAIGWLEVPAGWAIGLAESMAGLPIASVAVPGTGVLGAIALGVLACWLLAGRRSLPALLAGTAVFIGGLFGPAMTADVGPSVRLDMIAVDDGSAVLVRSGRGAVLWDAGSLRSGAGRWRIGPALRELGVWRLDAVVVSHPNLDHYNAIAGLAGRVAVDRVLISDVFRERALDRPAGGEAYALDRWASLRIDIGVIGMGDTIAIGAAELRVLAPGGGLSEAPINDRSLVALVSHPKLRASALLTGDIQRDGIAALGEIPEIAVMELPHHGSFNTAAERFVRGIDPEVVLQSTGTRRLGDDRWDAAKGEISAWWVTAGDGWSWAEIRPGGVVRTGSMRRSR